MAVLLHDSALVYMMRLLYSAFSNNNVMLSKHDSLLAARTEDSTYVCIFTHF